MLDPATQLDARIDQLRQLVESGGPVDIGRLNLSLDLDAVAATAFYANQSLAISNEADAATIEAQRLADIEILGGQHE